MRTVLILLALVLLVILGGIAFIYSGAFDVAATTPHSKLVKWALSTTMDHSVRSRAVRVEVPEELSDPALVREGAIHYAETCQVCHAGPGVKPSEIAQGLNPPAPNLAESAKDMSPKEIFWVIGHGIKMTGMPAFGPTHDDREMWSITAFVEALPTMSGADYTRLRKSVAGEHHQEPASEPETTDSEPQDHAQGGAGTS